MIGSTARPCRAIASGRADVRERLLRRAAATVAAMVVAMAAATGAHAARAPVVIAVLDNTFAATVYVAEAKGYFSAEGLDVKLERCKFGRTCLARLTSGEVRYATSADTPVMFSSLTDQKFSVLATLTTSSLENRIVVRADRGIRSVSGLKGRRIGAIKGTSSHYFMRSVLTYNGFAPSDAAVSWLDPSDLNGPIVRGEVDAVAVFGTQVHDVLRDLGGKGEALPPMRYFSVLFNLLAAPQAPGAGVGADDDVRLLRALKRAEERIRRSPDEAIGIVASALKLDRRAIAETWGNYEFRMHLGQALVDVLESQFRWAMREQLVPVRTQMPDFLDLLRPGPLRQVDARAVRLIQ